jgi:type II secretory pathway component PulM
MATESKGIRQRLRGLYTGLNDREQMLLKIAAVVILVMALILITLLFNRSLNSVEQEIAEYEEALDAISEVAPKVRGQSNQGANPRASQFTPEAIENNDIKLTSFVATNASRVGVSVDSYDENDRPIGSGSEDDSGSTLSKVQLNVDINSVAFPKLMQLLERIEVANEPVVIERVRMTRRSRTQGTVRATIVVTTFKKKADG